jgi:hypothetical protein
MENTLLFALVSTRINTRKRFKEELRLSYYCTVPITCTGLALLVGVGGFVLIATCACIDTVFTISKTIIGPSKSLAWVLRKDGFSC